MPDGGYGVLVLCSYVLRGIVGEETCFWLMNSLTAGYFAALKTLFYLCALLFSVLSGVGQLLRHTMAISRSIAASMLSKVLFPVV